MEKTVKVSVIMLAYNIENYIEIAIKGVLSQKTDYPVELIIGEDRSTDRTYEICKRYQEKYPELITVIRHEKNLGYQRNYMETYKHCRGEYVAVCDGDDYWFDRRKLQRATDFLDIKGKSPPSPTLPKAIILPTLHPYSEDVTIRKCPNGLPSSLHATTPCIC